MNPPGIDIDYKKRLFSLPFGLAPSVDAAFVGGLSLETDYLVYPRSTAAPRWPPSVSEVATIPFADGSGTSAVLPASNCNRR